MLNLGDLLGRIAIRPNKCWTHTSKISFKSNINPGRVLTTTISSSTYFLNKKYFPSCKWYTSSTCSYGYTTQYSVTPACSYNWYLVTKSCLLFDCERISTMISGAPLQPFSSSNASLHITHISGCTTVVTSLSLVVRVSLTSNGAWKTWYFFPF